MPYKQPPHYVYLAYRNMVDELAIDHDTAMDRLFQAFSPLPVDIIVQAEGDLSRTIESLTGAPPPGRPDTGKVDKRVAERLLRDATRNGQGGRPAPDDLTDFNNQIRARAARLDRTETQEMTAADIMAAGTGKDADNTEAPANQEFNAELRAAILG